MTNSRLQSLTAKPGQFGITLVEMLVVLVITAILAVLAAPSISQMRDTAHIKGLSDHIYSVLQFARGESVKRNAPVYLSTAAGATGWCIGAGTAASCNCSSANTCDLMVSNQSKGFNAWIASTSLANGTHFEPVRGLVQDSTGNVISSSPQIIVSSASGKQVSIALNPLGRASICSNAGATQVTGYATC